MTVYLSMVISLFWCFAVFFSIPSFFLLHTHTHAHGRKGQPMILLFLYYRRCHRKYDERIHRSCWIIITQWWKRISTKSTLILRWHWTTRKKSYLKITSELWTTNDRVWFMFCTKSNDNHFFFSILPLFVVVVGFIITINVCFFYVTGNRNFWLFCCVLDRPILRLAMNKLSNDSLMFFATSTKKAYSTLKSYHFNQPSTTSLEIPYWMQIYIHSLTLTFKHTHTPNTIISPLGTLYI